MEVALPDTPTRPADILVYGLDVSSPTAVDFSVTHPLQQSHNLAEVQPGLAAKEVERRKICESEHSCNLEDSCRASFFSWFTQMVRVSYWSAIFLTSYFLYKKMCTNQRFHMSRRRHNYYQSEHINLRYLCHIFANQNLGRVCRTNTLLKS